jgi:hypothetical protein
VLLCFEEKNELNYSLYHPIKSLGDMSVQDFLKDCESLTSEKGQLKRVKNLALKESFKTEISVDTYAQVTSLEAAERSKSKLIKLKTLSVKDLIDNFDFETEKIFILDPNGSWSEHDLETLANSKVSNFIKYIEDPVLNNKIKTKIKIASDFIDYDVCDYKIIKPTGFCHKLKESSTHPFVVTTYLDHPLGQIIAALFAKEKGVKDPCGLMSHRLFKTNAYSEMFEDSKMLEDSKISEDQEKFVFSDFSSLFNLLKKENWKKI